MGHEVWFMGVGDLTNEASLGTPRRRIEAVQVARALPRRRQGRSRIERQTPLEDLDVVMLRNDPADGAVDRPWAVTAGVAFGQLISANVLVLNDPGHLANALNRNTASAFPRLRPRAISGRTDHHRLHPPRGKAVLGRSRDRAAAASFLVSDEESPNLNHHRRHRP